MADYRNVGAHEINKWLWTKLKDFEYKPGVKTFDAWGASGFNMSAIFPAPQQAQVIDMTKNEKPYIVYNYAMSSYSSEWWICKEQCAYILYDDNEERLRATLAYVATLLKRTDWAPSEINAVASPGFDFKCLNLTNATGPEEYSTEGGVLRGATVVVSYEYTVNQDDNGMRI